MEQKFSDPRNSKVGVLKQKAIEITIVGSVKGNPGMYGACGWSLVQLDHDGELHPMRGYFGLIEAGFEVERKMERK